MFLLKLLFDDEKALAYCTEVGNAFLHFCALWKRNCHFSCFLCGNHPNLIVGDGNWKTTCQLPGWELHDVA